MATVTFAGGSLFTDFTSDDWYFDYVDDAVSLGQSSSAGATSLTPPRPSPGRNSPRPWPTWLGWTLAAYAGDSDFSDINGQWYSGAVKLGGRYGLHERHGATAPLERPTPSPGSRSCVTLANYAGLTYSGQLRGFQR